MAVTLNSLSVYCVKVENESAKTVRVSTLFDHVPTTVLKLPGVNTYSVRYYFYSEIKSIKHGSMRWDKKTMAVNKSNML
jgi:hypothetical protein